MTKEEMTKEEHIKRHKELHSSFDELLADFIEKTRNNLSGTTIMDLIKWSYEQTKNPTE